MDALDFASGNAWDEMDTLTTALFGKRLEENEEKDREKKMVGNREDDQVRLNQSCDIVKEKEREYVKAF